MKKIFFVIFLSVCIISVSGCKNRSKDCTDSYQFLVGVSLTNIMEPWLNNLAQVITDESAREKEINCIFRDAAGSTDKQIKDIEELMEYGIDLLIVSPDGKKELTHILSNVHEKIPVVLIGVNPDTEAYTSFVEVDDEGIGRMAGEYILEELQGKNKKIVVIEGVKDSPISDKRLMGFQNAVQDKVSEKQIVYCYGDWLQDVAESRMKDYIVVNGAPDIVFAFNDEMAYGAYIACEQLRVGGKTKFIGVDGFEGETAGLNLVEKKILSGTIQSPDFGKLAYDIARDILHKKEVPKNIKIVPQFITECE